jgi:hypothetical protein
VASSFIDSKLKATHINKWRAREELKRSAPTLFLTGTSRIIGSYVYAPSAGLIRTYENQETPLYIRYTKDAVDPLFALPFTPPVMLASSTSGDQHFLKSLNCADHNPIRIGDERERLVTASPVMTKSSGPSWKKQLPGERPRESTEEVTHEPLAQPLCSEERRRSA